MEGSFARVGGLSDLAKFWGCPGGFYILCNNARIFDHSDVFLVLFGLHTRATVFTVKSSGAIILVWFAGLTN